MDNTIKTPNQYLDSLNHDLQTTLGIKDTKLINSGPLSALANLLSNIAFDANKYYEYIIKEFNVATASQLKSMLFHASIYSYDFNLALPASVGAYIEIPNVTVETDRKIKYLIDNFSSFKLNGADFRIDGEVDIEITSDGITASLVSNNQIVNLTISQGTDSNGNSLYYVLVPSEHIKQVERLVEKFVVPSYKVGDNISFETSLPKDNQLYRTKIYVNPSNEPSMSESQLQTVPLDYVENYYPQLIQYQMKYFKFNSNILEKVVFANMSDFSNIAFTLGNGIYGSKLNTNDELFLIIEYCKGQGGNVPEGQTRLDNVDYYEFNTDNDTVLTSSSVNLIIKTTTPASGGMNASSINDIRFGILKKITERNSLITQLDFEKYFGDPVTGELATVISRQTDTMSPLVSVYNILRDPYNYDVIKTITMNKNIDDCFDSAKNYCINPTAVIDSTYNVISPFVYINYNGIYSYYKHDSVDISMNAISIFSNPEISLDVSVKWHTDDEYFYFEASDLGADYYVDISTNIGSYTLNSDNGFIVKIDSDNLIYNKFFKSDLVINDIKIKKSSNNYTIHIYGVSFPVTVMKRIQQHTVYEFDSSDNELLFLPYIDEDYYNNMLTDAKYEDHFINFFKISDEDLRNKLAYNIRLNQAFMNTINVDSLNNDSVVTNNNSTLEAVYPIDIDILYDQNVLNDKNLSLFNLKTDVQLAVLDYFSKHQGNKIKHYQTELIKTIKNVYPDILQEVIINSPLTLVTEGLTKTIDSNSYTTKQLLTCVPTYFYFDLNNMNINFRILDTTQQN